MSASLVAAIELWPLFVSGNCVSGFACQTGWALNNASGADVRGRAYYG